LPVALKGSDLIEEGRTLPRLRYSADLSCGNDGGCGFFDDTEAIDFELADDGGFAGGGRAGEDESFHTKESVEAREGHKFTCRTSYLCSSGSNSGRIVRAMIWEPMAVG